MVPWGWGVLSCPPTSTRSCRLGVGIGGIPCGVVPCHGHRLCLRTACATNARVRATGGVVSVKTLGTLVLLSQRGGGGGYRLVGVSFGIGLSSVS